MVVDGRKVLAAMRIGHAPGERWIARSADCRRGLGDPFQRLGSFFHAKRQREDSSASKWVFAPCQQAFDLLDLLQARYDWIEPWLRAPVVDSKHKMRPRCSTQGSQRRQNMREPPASANRRRPWGNPSAKKDGSHAFLMPS